MRTRLSALTVAIAAASVLTACGGGGGSDNFSSEPPAPTPTPAPTVTVTAPEAATAGTAFNVEWTSTNATSCAADFTDVTAATGSSSETEAAVGTATFTKTYAVTCTGAGGTATGSASVTVAPTATAEGAWQGTTGSGRDLAGVVGQDGNYWLAYTSVDKSRPAGFYAGQGVSSAGNFTPATALRQFNFEGGGAQQGELSNTTYTQSAGYTDANTFAGSFGAVNVGNVYDFTVNTTGDFGATAITFKYNGNWSSDTNRGVLQGSVYLTAFKILLNITQTFSMDETTGRGVLDNFSTSPGNSCSAYSSENGVDLGAPQAPTVCGAFGDRLLGQYWSVTPPAYNVRVPFVPADGLALNWALQYYGTPVDHDNDEETPPIPDYKPVNMPLTLRRQALPSITADTFTSTYSAVYEAAASIDAIAGSYTAAPAYTGIGSTMYTNTTTFSISSEGAIAGAESTTGCSYSGTIAPRANSNVYDVAALTFTGGSCAYASSGAFSGVATYQGGKLTVTATNEARDRGFMVVVAQDVAEE